DECDRASNRFSKLKRASEVLHRVARLKSLAEIFPEQLGQRRRKTGRPFWIAVDCLLHGSASYRRIARAWKVEPSTLRKYVHTYSESVRLAYGDERNWSLEQRAALLELVAQARARI